MDMGVYINLNASFFERVRKIVKEKGVFVATDNDRDSSRLVRRFSNFYTLDIPNKEVRMGLMKSLL